MSDHEITQTLALSPAQIAAIRELGAAAEVFDGDPPMSDQTLIDLDRDTVTHLMAGEAGEIWGYAQVGADSAELVVDPAHRGNGLGTALLTAVLTLRPDAKVWAHGNSVAAQALAARFGLRPVRQLLRMATTMTEPPVVPAHDFVVRTFEIGRDEGAWLAVNSAAFRDHPEQGAITLADLQARFTEPWFDPSGFLLAERDGRLLGYHWTKVVGEEGEVYVLGISPDAQGAGLGKLLLQAGLRSLYDRGIRRVSLYVEADNTAAVQLYRRGSFATDTTDVQYQQVETKALP